MMANTSGREPLVHLAREIEPILPEVVFVGAHVANLLITESGVTRVRPTTDVDVVVGATTRTAFRKLEERLRELGLQPEMGDDAVICRWHTPSGIILDVMPTNREILGFSNQWYPLVVRSSIEYELESDLIIRIPTAPLFIASKLEAFLGRGAGDLLRSQDLEDVITVVAGRPAIVDEVREAQSEVRTWIADEISELLEDENMEYAMQGALPDATRIPDLIPNVLRRLQELSTLPSGPGTSGEEDNLQTE